MSVSHATVRLHRNPALLPGAAALMAWLLEQNYSQVIREAIGRHVHTHGELAGAVAAGLLDREDEATATEVFIDALPDVPADSPAWEVPDVILDVELLLAGVHPWPFTLTPPELEPDDFDGPDVPDAGRSWSSHLAELIATGRTAAPPPISGGSPDAAPFEPSPADLQDYAEWSAELDRRHAAAEAGRTPTAAEVRAWLDCHAYDRPDVIPAS